MSLTLKRCQTHLIPKAGISQGLCAFPCVPAPRLPVRTAGASASGCCDEARELPAALQDGVSPAGQARLSAAATTFYVTWHGSRSDGSAILKAALLTGGARPHSPEIFSRSPYPAHPGVITADVPCPRRSLLAKRNAHGSTGRTARPMQWLPDRWRPDRRWHHSAVHPGWQGRRRDICPSR